MYNDFFRLKESPFNVTADSSFFFSSSVHSEAFAHIAFGIQQRKGIIAITGEIGAGKTTLCRTLLNGLNKKIKTALILNPKFTDQELLKMIVQDLGITGNFENKIDIVSALNEFLLRESSIGNNVVIVIDEAQTLSPDQLENIRLLSNIETEKEKLLQLVLIGQPELLEKLRLPELRQLNQRISVRYHIEALNKIETSQYIGHRLKLASIDPSLGTKANFTHAALKAIYKQTRGSPRMINILCDRALLCAFINNSHIIDNKLIKRCARELFLV